MIETYSAVQFISSFWCVVGQGVGHAVIIVGGAVFGVDMHEGKEDDGEENVHEGHGHEEVQRGHVRYAGIVAGTSCVDPWNIME